MDELASVVRCIQMGAADYLPKTVDPEILRARIEASMAQKRLHDLERSTLDQQVAINEVLRILSRSAFDLQVVLDAVVAAVARLCRADYSVAYVAADDRFTVARVVRRAGRLSMPTNDHTRSRRAVTRSSDGWP